VLKFYVLEKLKQAFGKVVEMDPRSATNAQIAQMEAELADAKLELGRAKVALDREKEEAVKAREVFDRQKVVVEGLIAEGREDDANRLLDRLPDPAKEEREAEEALAQYNQLFDIVKGMTDELLAAKGEMDSAIREVEKAKLEAMAAERQQERAKKLAGLKSRGNEALEVLKKVADEHKAKAEAAKVGTQLLGVEEKKLSAAERLARLS
jgi:hypothetical protein